MNTPHRNGFQLTAALAAILMGAQCIWLLIPELSSPRIGQMPADAASATLAAGQRPSLEWAADTAIIRGDYWAGLAFSSADLLWKKPTDAQNLSDDVTRARTNVERALRAAPHISGAWLLLAGLSLRYPSSGANSVATLKMSYYTGPSEQRLIPLRLWFAAQSDFTGDFEMREFVSCDLRVLLARQQKTPIIEAYAAALPAAKNFIEQIAGEVDPTAPRWLRGDPDP